MDIKMQITEENQFSTSGSVKCYANDGRQISNLSFSTMASRYCGADLKSVSIGGISTSPEYRRGGNVRKMLDKVFELAPERGIAISFLHPFSFSYYRKFGYEKVADHKVIEFPIGKLEYFERCADWVWVNSVERAEDCVKVYNRFAANRNIMFRRYGTASFPTDEVQGKKKTYLWYDASGEPAAYITLEVENYFWVNRMVSVNLNVYEMAFTSPEALRATFGFIRMFEGQNDTVKIHNCAMSPEVDQFLRHYMHTTYTLIPDIAARILEVPTVLKANRYPEEYGGFTVRVEDTLPFTTGTYQVEYQHGKAEVTRKADGHPADIVAQMPSFTQLLYGYEEYTADILPYMEGVVLNNPNSDFFKAFHKKNNGVFEHF